MSETDGKGGKNVCGSVEGERESCSRVGAGQGSDGAAARLTGGRAEI